MSANETGATKGTILLVHDAPPILMGHSFGGLMVQLLVDRAHQGSVNA